MEIKLFLYLNDILFDLKVIKERRFKMEHFFIPTSIFFGKNCLDELNSQIVKFGKKCMIITGANSAEKSGALSELLIILKKNNIEYFHFNKINENPQLNIILEGAELFKIKSLDFIIGIGGGSPIDAAKAISAIAANNLKGREIYQVSNINQIYPIIAIPTTAGTGTEATQYTIISDNNENKKAGLGHQLLFPTLSFVDPRYTLSLPYRVTLDTAIDALSHLLEGIYSIRRNHHLYPFIYRGIKLIYYNLKPCLKDLNNIAYRENLMQASLYGGMVISQAGTTFQHAIGYPLTQQKHYTHGFTNGLVMNAIMDFYYSHIEKELNKLWTETQISRDDFRKFIESLNFRLKDPLEDEWIESVLNEVFGSRNMASNPFVVTKNDIRNLYKTLV